MPYIKSWDYDRAVEAPRVPGELNYAITVKIIARLHEEMTFQEFDTAIQALVTGYFNRNGLSYTSGNAVMGVLDCATREMMRRTGGSLNSHYYTGAALRKIVRQLALERKRVYDTLLAPYEDQKIADNGDVYPEDLVVHGTKR